MFHSTTNLIFLLVLSGDDFGGDVRAVNSRGDPLYLVKVWDSRSIRERDPDRAPTNLAPALIATKDAGGELVQTDLRGNYVIRIPMSRLAEGRKSRAVRSISETMPPEAEDITALKLSYRPGKSPSAEVLRQLGLRLVQDEGKLSFAIVAPVNGRIDAALAERLERCPEITYVTPLHRVKAI